MVAGHYFKVAGDHSMRKKSVAKFTEYIFQELWIQAIPEQRII